MVSVLGKDKSTIFHFVRDEIRYQAYRGVLRGGEGALLARAGNSYDQALLLKEMLDAAGYRTRLARALLPEKHAALLLNSVDSPAFSDEPPLSCEDLEALGIDTNLWISAWANYSSKTRQAVSESISAAVADMEGMELPSPVDRREAVIESSRDYLWVQLLEDDRWVDLHPTFPAGKAPGLKASGLIHYVSSIPPQLFHWIRLKLFAERVGEDGLSRVQVSEIRLLSAAASGKGIAFGLRPEVSGEGMVTLKPGVKVGELIISGDPFSAVVGGPGEGALTALWLEIAILSPGERPRVTTLTLQDVLAAQRSLASDTDADVKLEPKTILGFRELGVSAQLAVVSGSVDSRVLLRFGAEALRWAEKNITEKASDIFSALEGLNPVNPTLLHWVSLLPRAWSQAFEEMPPYLDAPAVACVLYKPVVENAAAWLNTYGGVVFLRTALAVPKAESLRALPGLIAGRLLAAIAGIHCTQDEKVFSALDSAPEQEFSLLTHSGRDQLNELPWRVETISELDYDLLMRSSALVPKGSEIEIWWRIESGVNDPVARGPRGWSLLWDKVENPYTSGAIVSGELIRVLGDAKSGEFTDKDATSSIRLFLERHVLSDGASPLLPILSSSRGELLKKLKAGLGK